MLVFTGSPSSRPTGQVKPPDSKPQVASLRSLPGVNHVAPLRGAYSLRALISNRTGRIFFSVELRRFCKARPSEISIELLPGQAAVVGLGEREGLLLSGEELLGTGLRAARAVLMTKVGVHGDIVDVLCPFRLSVMLPGKGSILLFAVVVDNSRLIRLLSNDMVLVHVVGIAIDHLRVLVREFVGPQLPFIMVLIGVVTFYVAIPFVKEAGLDLYIKNLVFLAVIFARVFGQFTLAVVELQLLGYFCRQLLKSLYVD